jgi:hypothetical protein
MEIAATITQDPSIKIHSLVFGLDTLKDLGYTYDAWLNLGSDAERLGIVVSHLFGLSLKWEPIDG